MTLNALLDVPAPAKLNLFLHIVGRRSDGMHLLQSPFVLIDWVDVLHFERRDDGRIDRHDLSQTLPPDDLCRRAAQTLQAAAQCAHGVDISIDKQLPTGAGMGGGSSDAATVLLALNRLWGLNWPRRRLAQIGLQLGADVPFFIGGCNAFVEGIGERLTPWSCPPMRFAVVKPAASLSTADVFSHPRLVRDTDVVILAGSPEQASTSVGAFDGRCRDPGSSQETWGRDGYGRNDLQPPAEALCPPVGTAAGWLQQRYGNSRMTGSGSAVFARIEESVSEPEGGSETGSGWKSAAQACSLSEGAMALLPSDWTGRMCSSLPEHPLRGWVDGDV